MNRDGHNNVAFFIGPEVEKTPAFAKRTLFVVGRQGVADIEKHARDNKTTHIFMGANHSFDVDPTDGSLYWDKTITALLDKGYWVTLDYQAHQHEQVLMILNKGVWQSRLFVPLLSVRIPNIESSNPNLTVKIDDIDFKATNPGVWCMHFKEVTDSNRFTDWNEYESDSVLAEDSVVIAPAVKAPAPAPVKPVVEAPVPVSTVAVNDTELGLDVVPTTALKPAEVETVVADAIKTPEDAADAYAEGAKSDPLSAEASKKPKAKK